MQPFAWQKDAARHPFRLLAELNREQKHRRLTVAVQATDGGTFALEPVEFQPLFHHSDAPTLLKPGDYLVRVVGVIGGSAWGQSDFRKHLVTTALGFAPGVYVERVIDQLDAEVAELLDEIDTVV